jgi:hypothetical protein
MPVRSKEQVKRQELPAEEAGSHGTARPLERQSTNSGNTQLRVGAGKHPIEKYAGQSAPAPQLLRTRQGEHGDPEQIRD